MPIYEYECDGCGEVFEVFQKHNDPPPAKHDPCGSETVRRVMSQTTFQLKGSGWYITDYGKGGKGPKDGPKSGGDKGDSGKSSSAKADTSSGESSKSSGSSQSGSKSAGGDSGSSKNPS